MERETRQRVPLRSLALAPSGLAMPSVVSSMLRRTSRH